MARVVFQPRVGPAEELRAVVGQPLPELLRLAGIPLNAVLTRRNGIVVAERSVVLAAGDDIEVVQVRPYDLGVVRPADTKVPGRDCVYEKTILFDRRGWFERRVEEFDAEGFTAYLEEVFLQSVISAGTIRAGDRLAVGLSGGRDSVAFLKLLQRLGPRLPRVSMVALTVTGLPDWEEPATFATSRRICQDLGVEQEVVGAPEIEETFRLGRPLVEIMNRLAESPDNHLCMVVGHHILRRMLERGADRRDSSAIVLGFNSDDLLASLVTWFTSGFQMGGIPVRNVGTRRFVFPLYRVTKKELTLYLELLAPELSRQAAPGRFSLGPDERSMAYAVSDFLLDVWPGFDYYAFAAFRNVQNYVLPMIENDCERCGGTYLLQNGVENPERVCDVCSVLTRFDPGS
jgi:tRNA(Ile)-lysidine synthase TilS/MesJ